MLLSTHTFSTHYCYPLINKPTREVKNSKSIIYNIFSNIPYALDMCDVGIIRTYISDHHAIFCVLDTVISVPQHNNKQNIIIKRNVEHLGCAEGIHVVSRINRFVI